MALSPCPCPCPCQVALSAARGPPCCPVLPALLVGLATLGRVLCCRAPSASLPAPRVLSCGRRHNPSSCSAAPGPAPKSPHALPSDLLQEAPGFTSSGRTPSRGARALCASCEGSTSAGSCWCPLGLRQTETRARRRPSPGRAPAWHWRVSNQWAQGARQARRPPTSGACRSVSLWWQGTGCAVLGGNSPSTASHKPGPAHCTSQQLIPHSPSADF